MGVNLVQGAAASEEGEMRGGLSTQYKCDALPHHLSDLNAISSDFSLTPPSLSFSLSRPFLTPPPLLIFFFHFSESRCLRRGEEDQMICDVSLNYWCDEMMTSIDIKLSSLTLTPCLPSV